MVHCISLVAGERLRRLAEHYELVWATGWEDRANDYLPNLLGLPELPYLSFDGAARFGSAHWKLGPLDEYGRGRAMAWVDDNFDESCYAWARAGRSRPCSSPPRPTSASRRPRPRRSPPGLAALSARAASAPDCSTLSPVVGFWPIFFLLVVLKIPVLGVAVARLVGEQVARAGRGSGGLRRQRLQAPAARAEAPPRPTPGAPRRRRGARPAALSARRADPGRQTRWAACFRSRRISRR